MEALYLLCSIISTSFKTLILSLLLPLYSFLLRYRPNSFDDDDGVSLYQGTVWHERLRPVHHSFKYNVRYALIDLDRASRPPPDHLTAHYCRSIAQTHGPVIECASTMRGLRVEAHVILKDYVTKLIPSEPK